MTISSRRWLAGHRRKLACVIGEWYGGEEIAFFLYVFVFLTAGGRGEIACRPRIAPFCVTVLRRLAVRRCRGMGSSSTGACAGKKLLVVLDRPLSREALIGLLSVDRLLSWINTACCRALSLFVFRSSRSSLVVEVILKSQYFCFVLL